jgi:hypothetical protein
MSQSTLQLLLLTAAAILFLLQAIIDRFMAQPAAPNVPGYYGSLGWVGLCLVSVALLVPLVGK